MKKQVIERFIQKYNLNGNVNSVKLTISNNKLSTAFVTPDKSLLGVLSMDKFDFEDCKLGIYDTNQLSKMLSVVDNDINLSVDSIGDKNISISVTSGKLSFNYVLSDLSVIPEPPKLKHIPEFGAKIKLNSQFVSSFVKSKNALSDIDSFAVVNNDGSLECVIGYSSTNTNKINIDAELDGDCDLDKPILFNANLFKEVLSANKECETGIFEVSDEGLSRITFNIDDYKVIYYLVSMSQV